MKHFLFELKEWEDENFIISFFICTNLRGVFSVKLENEFRTKLSHSLVRFEGLMRLAFFKTSIYSLFR